MMFKRIVISAVLIILTSFFLFPVSFYFLPEFVNSKIMLAGFGIVAFFYDGITRQSFTVPKYVLYSAFLAFVFSLWCLFSVAVNGTEDLLYANYWVSFFTWLFGGYAICFLIRQMQGKVDLSSLTFYLAAVCLAQCILAEWIDHSPSFQHAVDSVFVQGQEFYHDIRRLYGIGASLDTAGVRFSVVLVLIAHQLSTDERIINNIALSLFYLISFAVIVIIGSIIARTTWVGAIAGLFYMIVHNLRLNRGVMKRSQIRYWALFIGITFFSVLICVMLYRMSPEYRNNLRFGFEGFFNWVETGVFRTDSTDKLNRIMWVWPNDTRSWILGKGLFDNWVFGTDIGYCRFTLYCGLVGLILFSLFFVYNSFSLIRRFPNVTFFALMLLALTFVVWLKVATDLFFIYALLFWLPEETDSDEVPCTSSTT